MSKEKTKKGIERCANWLHYCLSIGWDKKDLDGLEKIFWTYKDGNGDLLTNQQTRQEK